MKNQILFIFILTFITSFSQQEKEVEKKMKDLKVGLVLSGGGAKGLAHIGVIKVLEEAGVRIDYIGGTSAGAMVGALYASGYNAVELDSILRSYDYLDLIQNPNSRELYSFYQKENSEKFALTLPIKNRKIGLPVALSKGQKMLNQLSILTKHVHDITDFTKLPIPFYCVATDIETGNQITLENGFLPQAIRASGAFPSVFEPVIIDGEYLMDGGIVNNFPVDIMYKKDIDIIIGVDVQGSLETRDKLHSAVDVVMQIVSFQMYKNKQKMKNATDIYIKPDMSDMTVSSFNKMEEIINAGEKAARLEMEYLVSVASQQKKKPLKIRKKIAQYKNKYLKIKKVQIKGNKHYTQDYILSKLHLNRNKKDSITYEEFNKNINKLATTKNFESIDYKIRPSKDGSIIELNLRESEVSNFFQISTHYDALYKSAVLLNYTGKHFLTNNDIISTDIILGDNLRYNLNYLVDNGFHWRFGISHRYNSFKNDLFIEAEGDTPISFTNSVPVNYNDFTTKLYFQTKFEEQFAINGGFEHKYLNISTEILNDNKNKKFYFDKSNYYSVFTDLTLDTRDAKYFTKKGWYFKAKYSAYLNSTDYNGTFKPFSQIQIKFNKSNTFFHKLTSQISAEAGLTIGKGVQSFEYSLGGYNQNYINNYIPLYGFDTSALKNSNYLKGAFNLQYEFYKKNYLSVLLNAANLNSEFVFDQTVIDNFKTGYAIGYGINSIIGPLELKYAANTENKKKYWYFNIGFWF